MTSKIPTAQKFSGLSGNPPQISVMDEKRKIFDFSSLDTRPMQRNRLRWRKQSPGALDIRSNPKTNFGTSSGSESSSGRSKTLLVDSRSSSPARFEKANFGGSAAEPLVL